MKRQIVSFAAAAFFALGVSTVVWAQPTQDGGGRPSGSGGGTGPGNVSTGGSTSGGAVSSGGGGGGGSVSTSSGSVGGGGSSMGWGDRAGIDFPRASAPMRGPGAGAYSESQGGRSRGGGDSQGRAVPRGGSPSGGGGGGEGRATPRGEGGDRGGGAGRGATTLTIDGGGRDSQGPQRAAVPAYSRPREGRTPIGTPLDRNEAIRRGGIGVDVPWWYFGNYYGYPYGNYGYYNRNAWYPGFGFGLGYFYDPFWAGYGGYPYGYGSGYPYYGGYGGGSGYYRSRGYDTGSLRLKIQPRDAKVYVDGYFVGVVDSFDGVFQKLAVEAGTHRVEVRADGYEPAQFEIMVTPGETITYKGELKRLTQ